MAVNLDGIDPVRAWVGAVLSLSAVLVVASVAFPRQVYDGFVWRYFWGPVVADAHGARCAVRDGGETTLLYSTAECHAATAIVAEPGYTTVSTLSYALILVLALIGVVLLLRLLSIGTDRGFFFALFPFMLFGGTLRVVEDANVALLDTSGPVIPLPWSGLLISPLIYFVVFAIALAAVVASVTAARRGFVSRYEYPLFASGTVAFVFAFGFLSYLAVTTDQLEFHPIVLTITLVGATILTVIVWLLLERYWPGVNKGTGTMGALVIWGHTVDGVANVLSLDWAHAIGLPGGYAPKHVVNRLIIDVTGTIQPQSVTDTIGTAWPFLFVKIGAAVLVVWIFDEELFEESPRYGILLLIAILAVGLGPGTRDFLRATFGI